MIGNPVNDMIKSVTAFGASSIMNIVPSQISRFTDISDELKFSLFITTIIVLTIYILLLMATYKLTGSSLQTVMCFMFGSLYLMFAFIYYAFSGYKFVKSK